MLYSMCTYLHSFLDRNFILSSWFGHWEIIQQSLQIIRCDLRIPFMSPTRASLSKVNVIAGVGVVRPIWVHSIVFPVPAIHWVHWLWQLRGIWGRGRSWNCRGTQSHRLLAIGMCRKQFILKEIYLIC